MMIFFLILIPVLLFGLARFVSIYPHRPLVWVVLVPTFLSIGIAFFPALYKFALGIDLVIGIVAILDLFSLAKASGFKVTRTVGRIASLRKPHEVSILITNTKNRTQPVWIRDGLPEGLAAEPNEFCVQLPAMSRSTVKYQLRANRRGSYQLQEVYLRVRSYGGLWQRQIKLPAESQLAVYPDMQQLSEYALLARTNRLSMMGLQRTRKLGLDNEFERLRDYTLDDDYRHLDWRATARRNKLIVKDFQANQSQRIMFMIDCGRMMVGESNGVSLLDHALNAMLMLSYVALQKGDQVGLLCFSDKIHTYIPPRGGKDHMNTLLHASFDRFPTMVESRYNEAFLHLATHLRKRSLVVMVTNVIDEVNVYQIQQHLGVLAGKHLPLGILLRDHALFDAVKQAGWDRLQAGGYLTEKLPAEISHSTEQTKKSPFDNYASKQQQRENMKPAGDLGTWAKHNEEFFTAAAAAEILTWRQQVLAELTAKGVLTMDVYPEDLVAPLVNEYLTIKARHLL